MGVSENAARSNTPTARENTAHMDDLKDLLEVKIDSVAEVAFQRDLRYEARFSANDSRSQERFARMEEHTRTISEASEKAIAKAEAANEKRFDAVNEFRGALADQQLNLYPRAEAATQVKVFDNKIDDLKDEIIALREYRSSADASIATHGRDTDSARSRFQFNTNTVLAVLGIVLSIFALAFRLSLH